MTRTYDSVSLLEIESMIMNLVQLSRSTGLPSLWLRRQAEAKRIPALILGRSYMRFHRPSVVKALARMAAQGLIFPRPYSTDPEPKVGRGNPGEGTKRFVPGDDSRCQGRTHDE